MQISMDKADVVQVTKDERRLLNIRLFKTDMGQISAIKTNFRTSRSFKICEGYIR